MESSVGASFVGPGRAGYSRTGHHRAARSRDRQTSEGVSVVTAYRRHLDMPTLILICGLPGAGKTTLAKRLEVERSALRLTPDDWMARLNVDLFDEPRRTAIEALQWEIASRALDLGVDVILDWGFWSRVERDDYRQRATRLGARTELKYLEVLPAVLWQRVEARNAELLSVSASVTIAQLEQYSRVFEPPTSDEMALSNEGS